MFIYKLSNIKNMEYVFSMKDRKVTFLPIKKALIPTDVKVDEKQVFDLLLNIGKYVNNMGEISNKELFKDWRKKVGGSIPLIEYKMKELINYALEYKSCDIDNNKNDYNRFRKYLKDLFLKEPFYILNFSEYAPTIEKDFIEFLPKIYLLYELNNIILAIENNKIPNSKIWDFVDKNGNLLSCSSIYDIAKQIFEINFNITPLIRYNMNTNMPYYVFDNLIDIGYFYFLTKIISCKYRIKHTKQKFFAKTKICRLCGFYFIDYAGKTLYCDFCKTEASTNRQRKNRAKK